MAFWRRNSRAPDAPAQGSCRSRGSSARSRRSSGGGNFRGGSCGHIHPRTSRPPAGADNKNNACRDQRQRQEHAHGRAAEQKAQLRVRFAKKFGDNARDTVTGGKKPGDKTRPPQRAQMNRDKKHKEEDKSSEARFVELARVSRQRPGAGKNHRPRHAGRPSPKFRLDEIGNASEKKPGPTRAGANIGKAQHRNSFARGEDINRESGSGESAVKRHTAFPNSENLGRMREIKTRVVEKNVAEPSAENEPNRRIDEKIVNVQGIERHRATPERLLPHQCPRIGPAECEPGDTSQG